MVSSLAINVMSVRSKPIVEKPRFRPKMWFLLAGTVLAGVVATFAFGALSGIFGVIPPEPEIVRNGAARIIKVAPGGNVEAAIAKAESGDIVELQAGAVYYGEIKLPNKPLKDFVTIQSSNVGSLAPGKRVTPAQRSSMATIATRDPGRPAVSATNGANHYRFIGIEFTSSIAEYNYALVTFGEGETAANLPHDLEIDRSYIHPFKSGVVRRGIALNSAATVIKNSYIEGFGFPGEETQGICGWTGTRNVSVLNNYIEGGAENVLFGGGDPSSADLVPMDIEVRGNHLNKPEKWATGVTVKTLFQLKNAKRVQVIGNLMTNNWVGEAMRVTVRNQDNTATFSTIEDVVIKDNVIDTAGAGINILGTDDTYPSQIMKRLTIENNLFTNIANGGKVQGSGYFIQIADGENITIANNTVFNKGNITSFHGVPPRAFAFRDNIVGHGDYGIHGLDDIKSPQSRAMFQRNIFINLNRVSPVDYSFPIGNTIVSGISDVGFVNPASKDFRLSPVSRFAGKGSNLAANNE